MNEPRTVTLATTDHGDITIPEPAWCAGHSCHLPEERSDLAHTSEDVTLKWRGIPLSYACLDQAPYAEQASRDVHVSVSLVGQALDPRGVYELAAALDTYADQLRTLADQLTAIRTEGEQ